MPAYNVRVVRIGPNGLRVHPDINIEFDDIDAALFWAKDYFNNHDISARREGDLLKVETLLVLHTLST